LPICPLETCTGISNFRSASFLICTFSKSTWPKI
jgi:hypothetical protein